jgi:hypothetical protein
MEYNTFRPHNSLNYRPPAPEAYLNGEIKKLTCPPKTDPADKLVFWHNKIIEEEGLCHEEEIYGGADCLCFETG